MGTDADRRIVERFGDWAGELTTTPGVSVVQAGLDRLILSVSGIRLVVVRRDRLGSPWSQSRLWLAHTSGWAFDLGECISVIDGGGLSEVAGKANLHVVMGRMSELRSLSQDRDALDELVAARERWTAATMSPTRLGNAVPLPEPLDSLDRELADRGFVVTDEGLHTSGVQSHVRRRGVLGVLLAVEDGRTSVAVSVWPRFGWYEVDAARHLLGPVSVSTPDFPDPDLNASLAAQMTLDLRSQIEILREGADRLMLNSFEPDATSPALTRTLLEERWAQIPAPTGIGDPSRLEFECYLNSELERSDVSPEQLGAFGAWLTANGDDLDSAAAWDLTSSNRRPLPDVVSPPWTFGSIDMLMRDHARPVLEPHLADRTWFTFHIDGEPWHAAMAREMSAAGYLDLAVMPRVPLRRYGPGRHVHSARIAATRDGVMADRTLTLCRHELKDAVGEHGLSGFSFSPVWQPPDRSTS